MYRADNSEVPPFPARHSTAPWRTVPRNVWVLGLTSLLTDLSSEMVASVLPVYFVLQLHVSPLAFGALDGLYAGVSAATRWVSGILADRWDSHKRVALAGYLVSALSRIGLLAAGRDLTAIASVITVDRLAKGIRTAPRDALISLSAAPSRLGQSFGVHRTLDAAGAMLGPIAAFAVLTAVPGGFDVVFVTSFSVAIVGVGVILFFAENVRASPADALSPRPSLRTAIGLLRLSQFRFVVIAASALAVLTISDAFIYLALRDRVRFAASLFPVLYVGTALSYLLLATPAGLLADRFGRPRMFLAGHAGLLLVYAIMMRPPGDILGPVLAVALLGGYYAATDGVLAAMASGHVPASLRGSGLALIATATSAARFVSSIAFGWMWVAMGKDSAILAFAAMLTAGLIAASVAFERIAQRGEVP